MSTQPVALPKLDEVATDVRRVHGLPHAALAVLLIQVASVQGAIAAEMARAGTMPPVPTAPAERDRLLKPEEAAAILGVETQFLRRHYRRYRFAKKVGYRTIRYSENGIRRFIAATNGLTR